MILNGEQRQTSMTHSLNGSIIDIDMRHFKWQARQGICIHCVPMVLGGNLHAPCPQILDRLICTAMAELQFISFGTQSACD